MADVAPRRPADAYAVVAAVVDEADRRYFVTPPPGHGMRVTVVGHDMQPTQWDLSDPLSDVVIPKLQVHRDIRRVAWCSYGKHLAG